MLADLSRTSISISGSMVLAVAGLAATVQAVCPMLPSMEMERSIW